MNFIGYFGAFLLALLFLELSVQVIVNFLRKDFQWLINKHDEYPYINSEALKKFFKNSFDKELGWVRKPNSSGIEHGKCGDIKYHIDKYGSRQNAFKGKVSVASFGDSYTFCRQVKDNETWQVYLSQHLNSKVLNFGVGNYGVDQALLYYQKHNLPASTEFVILGFVPETICRVQSHWKHYLEFGNTFAFKPRFTFENEELIFHENPIKNLSDFNEIHKIIDSIKHSDSFYKKKFRKLQFRFPYLFTFFLNFRRNSILFFLLFKKKLFHTFGYSNSNLDNAPFFKIMKDNLDDAYDMYKDKASCDLLENLLLRFCEEAQKKGHKPLIVVMPQLIDLKANNDMDTVPYTNFFLNLSHKVHVIDMTKHIKSLEQDEMYTEDLYGGHFSARGNKLVANTIFDFLKNNFD